MASKDETKNVDIKETKETVAKKTTKKQEPKRKAISDNVEVEFINNTNGLFVYEDKNTGKSYYLGEFGDSDYITIKELNAMKREHKGILSKFWILLVNVLDDEIELNDVIEYLGLKKEYENALTLEEVDSLLINRNEDKFESVFGKLNNQFKQRVIERAIHLFDNKEFNDMYKANIMKEFAKDDSLFQEKKEDK